VQHRSAMMASAPATVQCMPARLQRHLHRGDLPRATRVFERGLDLCRTWQFVVAP
jgi:hypothetical protein